MTESLLEERNLKMGTLPLKGRCLYAAKDFSPGEVVLDQSPYVAVLNSYTDRRCDSCYREDHISKRCSSCKSVWYCSISCQKREWIIHKYECKCLVKLMEEEGRGLTPSLRLMLRLLIKRLLQRNKSIKCSGMDNYQVVEALPTHIDDTPEQQLVLYAQMANLVKLVFIFEDVDVKEVLHNFCRFACNAHTIFDPELRPLGVGLYPIISIINHSCHPNCILLFEGKNTYVRAIEEITEGDEVTVSYVDLGENTSTRLRNLREQYFFECRCQRCLGQAPRNYMLEDDLLEGFMCPVSKCQGLLKLVRGIFLVLLMVFKAGKSVVSRYVESVFYSTGDPEQMACQVCGHTVHKGTLLKQVDSCDVRKDEATKQLSAGTLSEARHTFERLNQMQARIFQECSLHRMKTYDNLSKVCISMEDWTSALFYCHQAISAYKRVYQPNHPLLGLQFYTCGKLEWYLGKTSDALESYKQALTILQITHGPDMELVKNLKAALQEAQAEAFYLQRHGER